MKILTHRAHALVMINPARDEGDAKRMNQYETIFKQFGFQTDGEENIGKGKDKIVFKLMEQKR